MVGGGGIKWTINGRSTGVRPTFDFGIGLRYWISRRTSIRLEALENIVMEADGKTDDMIYLSIGVSIATFRREGP